MTKVRKTLGCIALYGSFSLGQQPATFDVTGTSVPAGLLRQNYGVLPRGVGAYDISICNLSANRQTIVNSQVFQSLVQTNPGVQPIGRQIMLAAILHNQERSTKNIVNVSLNAMTGIFAVLGASKYSLPSQWATGFAVATLTSQPILNALRPVMSADQVQKFESQVLESALVLDSGACAERTVFTVTPTSKDRVSNLSFHVR